MSSLCNCKGPCDCGGDMGDIWNWVGCGPRPGPAGKSAYELAVENGYTGNEQLWLKSLIGPSGKDGKTGKSAYEVAVENGYTGTVTDFLNSLKGAAGKDGTNGKDGASAYDLAVKNGFLGTLTNWLDSLHGRDGNDGKDGAAGKSAYEIAVEKGFEGTEQEFLNSLKGADGIDGKDGEDGQSAYGLAVASGFRGTEQQWLDSLVGMVGDQGPQGLDAYEVAVNEGYEGTREQWLENIRGIQGETGVDGYSAYDIATQNGFEGTETEWLESLIGPRGERGKSAYEIAVENGFEGTESEWIDRSIPFSLVYESPTDIKFSWVGHEIDPDDISLKMLNYKGEKVGAPYQAKILAGKSKRWSTSVAQNYLRQVDTLAYMAVSSSGRVYATLPAITQANYAETNAEKPSFLINKPFEKIGAGLEIENKILQTKRFPDFQLYIKDPFNLEVVINRQYDNKESIPNFVIYEMGNYGYKEPLQGISDVYLNESSNGVTTTYWYSISVSDSAAENSLFGKDYVTGYAVCIEGEDEIIASCSVQQQSDYGESDPAKSSFIKNKPFETIGDGLAVEDGALKASGLAYIGPAGDAGLIFSDGKTTAESKNIISMIPPTVSIPRFNFMVKHNGGQLKAHSLQPFLTAGDGLEIDTSNPAQPIIKTTVKPEDMIGADGKSTYDLAVENGFEGTEQEFLDYDFNRLKAHLNGLYGDLNTVLTSLLGE